MGMFYDDGVSFVGVHALSRELAFLIGATRDNGSYKGCAIKDGFLTGPLDDSTSFRLSTCAKVAVRRFFLNNSRHNCWNDTPTPIMHNNWTLPSKCLEDSLHEGRVDLCAARLFYLPFIVSCKNYSSHRRSRKCRVDPSCCDKDTHELTDYVKEPDGRACGHLMSKNKMCIHGECVMFS
ncbi:uncharacterized protein LOC120836241 [Ixodes scapularis]|uniref:uncharacterized protein LOC120836241 n=1 Tax=Ixodes scapularis TaxID=6945 RepID=UPI001A9D7471|nr:uncharacterized protein LOC120836241 [Ixodes scapularis]